MKAKPLFLVVVTLIIGFVLGMLTSAQVRFHKLKPVRMYFSEEKFREGFFNAIQPDEKQKAEIVKILDKYAKMNVNLQADIRRELDSNLKSMRTELDSKLTKEQLARLKEMEERRQEMIRQNMKNMRNPGDSTDQHNRPGGHQGPSDQRFQDGRPMHQPPDRPSFSPNDTSRVNR
jgi:F0F1-type ATP synthase assembly protein I